MPGVKTTVTAEESLRCAAAARSIESGSGILEADRRRRRLRSLQIRSVSTHCFTSYQRLTVSSCATVALPAHLVAMATVTKKHGTICVSHHVCAICHPSGSGAGTAATAAQLATTSRERPNVPAKHATNLSGVQVEFCDTAAQYV